MQHNFEPVGHYCGLCGGRHGTIDECKPVDKRRIYALEQGLEQATRLCEACFDLIEHLELQIERGNRQRREDGYQVNKEQPKCQ